MTIEPNQGANRRAPRIRIAAAVAAFAVIAHCGVAAAQEASDPHARRRAAFDPTTGRDLLNYPPHRSADILHERIELEIPDMNTPRMSGAATIRFTPITGDLSTLSLHASELFIRQVSSDGRTARFSSTPGDDRLEITFDPPVPFGQTAEVRIEYEVNDPAEGIVWTPESPQWPGRPASFHSQGESEFNRAWFPTFDFPSERLTSEIIVVVPGGYQAVSNGHLVSHESTVFQGTGSAAERWHWLQDKEHAPYLISLDVGKWDVVDVSTFGARLPMPVYAMPGQGKQAKKVFARTPKMISLYERLFDEPYPWDKYAQVVVTNFAWGGMENTSATTLYDTIVQDDTSLLDGDEDELICHELAHQWFGDLLTCKSWEHIWLNEGWATYSEALWQQYKDAGLGSRSGKSSNDPSAGLKADNDGYQYAIWKNFREVIDNDKADAPYQPAMVSKEYAEPDAVFDREANPYPKGSAVLHMLRERLTDPIFWRAAALYVDRHRNQPVETYQFRLCFEEVSGQSLQRFFDQWCYRPGVPALRVSTEWDATESSLSITVEQTQNIDGPNPAFAFELPVWVDDGSTSEGLGWGRGGGRTLVVPCETRSATKAFKLARQPRRIAVDPEMTVLADVTLAQPAPAFVETLRSGPTLAAKLQAVRHLAQDPGDRGIEALAAVARDNRASFGLRLEALQALGRLANPEGDPDDADDEADAPKANQTPPNPDALAALVNLARSEFSDARIRESLVKQLGIAAAAAGTNREAQKPVVEFLLNRWNKDRSYDVRAESLRSLGRLKTVDGMKALAEGLKTESQHDQIREGAIDGLKMAAFPDALDQVLPMTLADRPPGTRQAALRAAGALASQDPERVFNLLSALINDTELRTRRAAVETLLKFDDPRAELTIDQWISGARSRSDKLWGRELLESKAAK